MNEDQYTDDTDVSQPQQRIAKLENRIEQLEATTKKMMPSRRDALKYGGAAALGAAAMSGSASAGTSQVGTIGDPSNLVDVEAEDIDVSDTLTTQDIVVNGTATGPFGGGAPVFESGDTITIASVSFLTTDQSFVSLYNGTAKDVLCGFLHGAFDNDFLYEFSDGTTFTLNSGIGGTSYVKSNAHRVSHEDGSGGQDQLTLLPPAKDVVRIEIGTDIFDSARMAGQAYLLG